MKIRPALPEEWEIVRRITLDAYAKWVPLLGREPLPMLVDYRQAILDHRIDFAERDGDVLGLIELVPGTAHLLIENLAVDPAAQGQGVGRALMAHAQQLAHDQGLAELRLYTNKLFEANIRFYRGLGFKLTQEQPFRGGTVCHFALPMDR
ncbi:GNAT family N-acetyltransferase [Lacibacterium aquatile]|uniref:GNAT family N-acetyltransferase n=1 Tax=Lacibacterium aquatile TaxID=1168082 RepID=A0ABW5DS25_9PROT